MINKFNQQFDNQKHLFEFLKKYQTQIIDIKKNQVYKSKDKGQLVTSINVSKNTNTNKSLGFDVKKGFSYPIINTSNYMDSHDDVHFPQLWEKSKNEQKGRIYYKDSHGKSIRDIVVDKSKVELFTANIPWSFVGKDYDGETYALLYGFNNNDVIHKEAKYIIENKLDIQNSVSMKYIKIFMGVNSDDKELVKNRDYFEKRKSEIVNIDKVEEQGFFFGVEEAAIIGEGSMVTDGSNDATSFIYDNIQPSQDTEIKIEPSIDTQSDISYLLI